MSKHIDVTINGKTYRIKKFGAIAGRSIVAQYPLTMILQNKEYSRNEDVMLKLMSHVEVVLADGNTQPLTTKALIDNHVEDWSDLVSIEIASLKYNAPQFFDKAADSLVSKLDSWVTAKFTEVLSVAIGENLKVSAVSENKGE